MARPSRIRRLASYLRTIAGPGVPFRELLRFAAILVEAHLDPERGQLDEGYIRAAFHALEVDIALGDGGWRVLEFERRAGMKFED